MIKKVFFVVAIFASIAGFSQDEDAYVIGDTGGNTSSSSANSGGFNWDRVTIGGGLGLSFGTVTLIEVAPTFGYYLTDNFLVGIGGDYIYFSDDRANYSTSIYGASIFAEYFIQGTPIMLHVEPELINFESTISAQPERINVINMLAGGGIRQKIGGNSYVSILLLYNLTESKEDELFQRRYPIIRGGIAIGL
jgi:hypothetical protein